MVAYAFQERFADKVARGEKTQTIRAPRAGKSKHAAPGERVTLYKNMRRPDCTLLAEGARKRGTGQAK